MKFEIIDTEDYFGPPLATVEAANYIAALAAFARACGYTSLAALYVEFPDARFVAAVIE